MSSSMVTRDPLATTPRFFGKPAEVAPDVFMHPVFVNSYALRTTDGLALVDPGFGETSEALRAAVRAWSDAPLRLAVYTHGHADHAFGLRAFLAAGEHPDIVAQENCAARFRRYEALHGLNARINQRQFGLPEPVFPRRFDWPTTWVRERLARPLGDVTLDVRAARGETDDALWVWIPERGYLFTGDLVIWQAPNCGNPQKMQRYPEDWADALDAMAAVGADWLFPGHGLVVQGEAAVRQVLTDAARYLRVLVDGVRTRLNAGERPEDIVHAVRPDPELAARPYLAATYDHPSFIVRNLLRLWAGWWDGNAAHLLPATPTALAAEVAALAGGTASLVARSRTLLDAGDATLAAHLAEWAVRVAPESRDAQVVKRDVYRSLFEASDCLMARGIYRAALNDAERALGEATTPPGDRGMTIMTRNAPR
jgi:glyoxylase-like metal-dependent hydrolase (beta-lactamase superfamily II)